MKTSKNKPSPDTLVPAIASYPCRLLNPSGYKATLAGQPSPGILFTVHQKTEFTGTEKSSPAGTLFSLPGDRLHEDGWVFPWSHSPWTNRQATLRQASLIGTLGSHSVITSLDPLRTLVYNVNNLIKHYIFTSTSWHFAATLLPQSCFFFNSALCMHAQGNNRFMIRNKTTVSQHFCL